MTDNTTAMGAITREEWVRRYAARIVQRAGLTDAEAAGVAEAGAESCEQQERGCGNAVLWWGGPSGAEDTPEDCADEELSYWTDDGE